MASYATKIKTLEVDAMKRKCAAYKVETLPTKSGARTGLEAKPLREGR